MKPILKRTLIVVVVFIVGIQFLPMQRNVFPHIYATELYRVYPVPAEVQTILQRSCYDCHSANSTYPWYSNIQPVGWWMNHHIEEGKQHLSFNLFGNYSPAKKIKKLKEIAGTVSEGEMPMASYTLIHKDAILSASQKELVRTWALTLAQQIADTARQ